MSHLRDVLDKIRHGTWGFSMLEEMKGEHQFEPAFGPPGRRPMVFRVRWGAKEIRPWLRPGTDAFLLNDLEGTVTIDGLCHEAPCKGSLHLKYFADFTIRYAFEFEVSGQKYRFVGEKMDIKPWNLVWSHTKCFGRLVKADTGELVSTSLTHFRFRTAPKFAASLRLH